jgi:Polysaccharide lyase
MVASGPGPAGVIDFVENESRLTLNLPVFDLPISCKRVLLLLLGLCASCTSTAPTGIYSITLDEGTRAFVKRPNECGPDMRNGGGDLVEGRVMYQGKCEGAGVAPAIYEKDGIRYLKFATDPSYQGKTKTRSELALTGRWFPFGEPVYVGFRTRIPKEADRTQAFFYMMQFWQCAGASPIGGVRISRGYSHRVNFMTRSDSRAASMATYDLSPDSWTSFVIKVSVDPGGKKGSFAVWNDPEDDPRAYNGPYGYAEEGRCKDEIEPPQRFRIKFGIYKGNENNKLYEVDYDDIRIGNTFDAVSPWKAS